ncbi:iron chelate uptake ABC transporter family permease subunit [Shinella daejeonensis]|uniref:FecCD family ABC transporter permease n=1 Tax=Shinella daejeonensis TaxID=659017 RepID=UPI0020C7BA73|nr:iron chelate uptake ABC transporter family permease subunit [Shinella daejeonensis]MCP8896216.1 iron chelate uptake ABC transporter family permease subunit [Shinella daejeonensis]
MTARLGLAVALASSMLCILALASLAIGAKSLPLGEVLAALTGDASDVANEIVAMRVPRMLLAILAGIGFALAGAVMQAVTRNVLADPGIMGVNAGASLAVVLCVALTGMAQPMTLVWAAMGGALVTGALVQIFSSLGGATALRLVLCGVAMSAIAGGAGWAVTLSDPDLFRRVLVWGAGSLIVTDFEPVRAVAPFVLAGVLLTLVLGPRLNAIALGNDLARSLGVGIAGTQMAAAASVVVLAGAATSATGPVGFVGLLAPLAARAVVGVDQRAILALTALLGPVLLLSADLLARVVLPQGEAPLGIVMAFAGAPVLIALAYRIGDL